jgi:indolepyruvate ferredoxin oxidoreductase beta subunit
MSHVRLSKKGRYQSPLIPPNHAHIIVGLEPLETLRVMPEYGQEDTVLIVNRRPIHPLNVISGDVEYPDLGRIREVLNQSGGRLYWFDATEEALKLGGSILMNMIMLGALCGLDAFPLQIGDLKNTLRETFSGDKREVNYRALELGMGLVKDHEN